MTNTGVEELPPIPARMVNEYAYCSRLFFLEWVDREFDDNHFTVEGRVVHKRVDGGEPTRELGAPEGGDEPWQARSVDITSESLGVTGKLDIVEGDGTEVMPVDTKRGRVPDVPEGAWEPERVQLCLYGLMLREAGYACSKGALYFAGSRRRVQVPFTDELVARTKELVAGARAAAGLKLPPPPLKSDRKCDGCSLAGLCMPDELNQLTGASDASPRPLFPARDDAQPVYVVEAGARVGVSGECLEIRSRDRETLHDVALVDVSHVALIGNVQISSQAVRELTSQGIPVGWFSWGGWLNGVLDGAGRGQVTLRQAQYAAAASPERSLALAREFIYAKVLNCRTFLRRNLDDDAADTDSALRELAIEAERVRAAPSAEVLLGLEGNSARIYFARFGRLLRGPEALTTFDFNGRNRRPPKDAVNALLSFAYAMLTKDIVAAARVVGFDPWLGFFHQPRHGRFALALDLMEEFRPLLADSVVINVINMGVLGEGDFLRRGIGVTLNPEGRKKFLRAWERRLSEQVTHPIFGYRVSYRRILEMQCRLLARHLVGELPAYPGFRTR
jgi:CRISPR-associated endonuclease Cas1/CRISPR-associated protein Cas4